MKKYEVEFTRHAYMNIYANSPEEAMEKADETATGDTVYWSEDWPATGAMEIEGE